MPFTIDVKLPRKMRELLDAKKLNKEVMETVALEAEARAKRLAPVDHGRLRASIEGGVDSEGGYLKAQTEYAAFQEFGTTKRGQQTDPGPTPSWYKHGSRDGGVPSKPFLRPAIQSLRGQIGDIVKR